jgi:NADH-quinone oxidoreductase subunit D
MTLDPKAIAAKRDTLRTEELLINMGPQHPSTHGVLRLVVRTDGEIVRETWPQIGFLHRSFEKIAESVGYHQVVPYTDRIDYLGSMNNAMAFCLAVEKLGSIETPERAAYLRVIAAELNRIASHLVAFGTYALDLGAFTPFLYGFREREYILSIFEKLSGGRLLYHYPRIGGVARDITPEIADDIRAFLVQMRKVWPEYNTLLSENQIFVKRTANVGAVTREQAIAWGLTGPCLRGSGVRFDLRKQHPYSCYERFQFDVPIGEGLKGQVGDCWDRYWVRMVEILESCKIVEQALDGLPEGPIRSKTGRDVKLPEGEVYVPCENPRGELGFYIVSNGDSKALRVKSRGPSFCNLSITHEICRNVLLADVVAIVGSIDIVLGEVDR